MAILRNNRGPIFAATCVVIGTLLLAAPFCFSEAKNSCLHCHAGLPDQLGVTPEKFAQDIHAQKGLSCVSCHGGDANDDDPEKAMSRAAGWKGKIEHRQVPQLCGGCHSDPAFMRQYNPSLRTDQLGQYHTSVHGRRLEQGDKKVAVCTDCHGVHDLKPPSDPRSTVNPVNVATTCSRCHADANYMQGYSIPTDQFTKYNSSVHHEALAVRGDLSAPTCTTCHGNHGAAPPGIDSVRNVCATCHVFQAQMFEKSTHKQAFARSSLPGCVVCHSNHGIMHPSDATLGMGPAGVCFRCHAPGDHCDQARQAILTELQNLDGAIKNADRILGLAESSGMEVSEARLAQNEARDSLTKARVTIHSFRADSVKQDITAGLKIANSNYLVGQKAMAERSYRRIGLGISLIAVCFVVVGLGFYIKRIENQPST
jgi:Cytochrome c3